MNSLLFVLINGFLFSISSSSVTTNNSTSPSPVVIQENTRDQQPTTPTYILPALPQPQNNCSSTQGCQQNFKQHTPLKYTPAPAPNADAC